MGIIGILGGMGPLATADLFYKIISNTAAQCDSDHIRILLESNTEIPDRTNHILGLGPDPLPMLIDSALRLEVLGAQLIVMPCNTAHYYYKRIIQFLHIPMLNMIEETAKAIRAYKPEVRQVGLLATLGTYVSKIYEDQFQRYGLSVMIPDKEDQKILNSMIYAVKGDSDKLDGESFRAVLKSMKRSGAELFVLGCTELPIAWNLLSIDEESVDPTEILAKSTIRTVGKKIKGES